MPVEGVRVCTGREGVKRPEECIEAVRVCRDRESVVEAALQRQSHLYIHFLGIARPQSQFPHSCVCERFIYSQDRSAYFLQQNRQTDPGNISISHRYMSEGIGR